MIRNFLHQHLFKGSGGLLCFVLISLLLSEGYGEGADLFSAQALKVEGSKLAVIPADLDGRGALEIVVASKTGVYPEETRWISIFSLDDSAQYSWRARQRWEIDRAASVIDVGDVAPSPGKEIF